MRAPGNEAVMRRGVENTNLRSDLFEPRSEFSKGGVRQNPGTPAEEIGVRGFGAPLLFAGHGVSADEAGAAQMSRGGFANGNLGAAGVGHERSRFHERIEMFQGFENPGDGLRKKDEIG